MFKQRNGMRAVNIVGACGVITPEQFAGLAEAVRNYGAWRVKLTGRQTIVVLFEDEEKLKHFIPAVEKLGLKLAPYGSTVRAVKACPGNSSLCPRALGDALDLGIKIQAEFLGEQVPKDLKVAVCGCFRGCTDPYCADFGVVARGKDCFDVYVGGRGGSKNPVHGQKLASGITSQGVINALEHVINCFRKLGQPKERLGLCISRVGLEPFSPAGPGKPVNSALEEFGEFLKS